MDFSHYRGVHDSLETHMIVRPTLAKWVLHNTGPLTINNFVVFMDFLFAASSFHCMITLSNIPPLSTLTLEDALATA